MTTPPLSLLTLFELLLRGGAVGASLLAVGMLLGMRPLSAVTVFGSLFRLCAALYAVISIMEVKAALGPYWEPLLLVAILSPVAFWLFVLALFDDDFTARPWMALPPAAAVILFSLDHFLTPGLPYLPLAIFALMLSLLGHATLVSTRNWRNDLVSARRRFTRMMPVIVPFTAASMTMVGVNEVFAPPEPFGRIALPLMMFIVAIAFGIGIAGPRTALAGPRPRQAGASVSVAEGIELARLQRVMEDGAHLQPGLTIGQLANNIGLPEHRLRRLINGHLGYRNFSAFINDYRIEEAQRRLSEPEAARDQITHLAFDLGYSSLAPFNRAFRERTGVTPSQYRDSALARQQR